MKSICVPGSKSVSNRALVLSFLCKGPVELQGLLECDDTKYLKNALSELENRDVNHDFFIGNGGTPARFLAALSLVVDQPFRLHGVDRMHERPFGDLFEVLENLGVEIQADRPGFLPARLIPPRPPLQGGVRSVHLSGSVSSQFISGLLLAGTKMGLEIEVTDEIKSRPYVEMTVEMIQIFGGTVEVSDDFKHFKVLPGLKGPGVYAVPADCSSASYPLAWGIMKGEEVQIENMAEKTLQGDEKFVDFLQTINTSSAPLRPGGGSPHEEGMVEFDFSKMPDVSMTGMIIAACTPGVWKFTGLESLRVKECDRIAAMAEGLKKLGVQVEVDGDDVMIKGKTAWENKTGVVIDAQDDHRIAMCFGILRNALELDFEITDLHCVAKSWPNFWEDLADWSGQLREVSSVIVKKNAEYLIVRKPRAKHAWQFPQGGVDAGEGLLEAAQRELEEECGCDLHVKFLCDSTEQVYKYLFPKNFTRHDKNITGAKVHFFEAEYVSGDVKVDGEEIVEALWVTRDELKDYFSTEYLEACFSE